MPTGLSYTRHAEFHASRALHPARRLPNPESPHSTQGPASGHTPRTGPPRSQILSYSLSTRFLINKKHTAGVSKVFLDHSGIIQEDRAGVPLHLLVIMKGRVGASRVPASCNRGTPVTQICIPSGSLDKRPIPKRQGTASPLTPSFYLN